MGRYKPECSRKQEKIFLGSDNDTLSSRCQYLPDYLPVETGSYRRGRGLGGRVGVASGRLEGSGGGEASKGEVREGQRHEGRALALGQLLVLQQGSHGKRACGSEFCHCFLIATGSTGFVLTSFGFVWRGVQICFGQL